MKLRKRLILMGSLILAVIIATSTGIRANDENEEQAKQHLEKMVVKSTKMDRKLEHMTDSVTIINEEELRLKGYTDLTEVLRFSPSVEFKQAGGPGQFNYPKMRGYGEGHFLVLVNGMKINEAYNAGVGHFLGHLDPKLIGSLEILRGPQAALYGSDTTAGVMSITTISGKPGTHFNLAGESGSLDWSKGFASIRGGTDRYDYSLGLAYIDSDGVHEHEYYDNFSPTFKLGFHGDTFDVTFSYLYIDTEFQSAELDEPYGSLDSRSEHWAFQTPDPNNINEYEHDIGTVNVEHRITEYLKHKAVLGWFKKEQYSKDLDDGLLGYERAPFDNFSFDGNTYNRGDAVPIYDNGDGRPHGNDHKNWMFDYNLIWTAQLGQVSSNSILLGYEYLYQEGGKWGKYGDLEADAYNYSFYMNDQLLLLNEVMVISAGLRHDRHQAYGSETTGKLGVAYTFLRAGTTFFSNYGTSFRAPTFFNLYDAVYGNLDITPEEGWTVEGGVRQSVLDNRMDAEITYWYSELDDVIVFDYTIPNPASSVGSGKYGNRDSANTEGIEVAFGYHLNDDLLLSGNYTYTSSRSENNGEEFRTVQIARNKGSLTLAYQIERLYLALGGYYVGPRLRWKGDIEMDEYTRIDFSTRYNINDEISFYARIENLFNEDIEEGLGYEQPDFYGIAGLEWRYSL